MSCAKTAEPTEIPFGQLSWVSPGNHVLDGGADAPTGRGTFSGVSGPLQSIGFWGICKTVSCMHRNGWTDLNDLYDIFMRMGCPLGSR